MDHLKAYKEIFQLTLHESLTRAIQYLLKHNRAKTLTSIAQKMSISQSTLTGYMKGTKQISRSFQLKFEEVFELDLMSTATYSDSDMITELIKLPLPTISGEVYLTVFNSFQKYLRAQQMIIEGLKKTNQGLILANEEMYNFMILEKEKLLTKSMGMNSN